MRYVMTMVFVVAVWLMGGPAFAQAPVNNLELFSATYLGDGAGDAVSGVDITTKGVLVVGGTMPTYAPPGITPLSLLGGGEGVIIRLDYPAQTILSLTRLGGAVNDLAVNDVGELVVCGEFGVALLNDEADTVHWHDAFGPASSCALGEDGTVAVLENASPDRLRVYNRSGAQVGTWTTGSTGRHFYDVAVDSARNQVISTGYDQKSSNLQVAFIEAHTYDGSALNWTAYDFSNSATLGANLGADTRGINVVLGRDGLLYFSGSINGGTGASIFSRDPQNISERLTSDRQIEYDNYNRPTNVGSVSMAWYGRFNPADGELLLGQSLLTRLSSGRGNSISILDMAADVDGRLYVVGQAWASMAERDSRQVAGVTVGGYSGGESYLLVVAPDFRTRLVWTPFTAPGESAGGSPATGVAVRQGIATLVANLGEDRRTITHNALQSTHNGSNEAYLVTWPQIEKDITIVFDEPPRNLRVSGPAEGFINTAYQFQASINLTATAPLSFSWQASNGSAVVRQVNSQTDTLSLQWASTGPQRVTVVAANAAGVVTATHDIDIQAVPPVVTDGSLTQTLIYTDGQGLTTTVVIPAGTVTEATEFRLIPLAESGPTPLGWAETGHAWRLEAYRNGELVSDLSLSQPLRLRVYYSQADITAINEAGLRVFYRSEGSAWLGAIDAANTCFQQGTGSLGTAGDLAPYYASNVAQNWLQVQVCALGELALWGPQETLYLPLVLK